MKEQPDARECADGLCWLALEQGCRDNVSCVVVDVVGVTSPPPSA